MDLYFLIIICQVFSCMYKKFMCLFFLLLQNQDITKAIKKVVAYNCKIVAGNKLCDGLTGVGRRTIEEIIVIKPNKS